MHTVPGFPRYASLCGPYENDKKTLSSCSVHLRLEAPFCLMITLVCLLCWLAVAWYHVLFFMFHHLLGWLPASPLGPGHLHSI